MNQIKVPSPLFKKEKMMKYCPLCGEPNDDLNIYCHECHESLYHAKETITKPTATIPKYFKALGSVLSVSCSPKGRSIVAGYEDGIAGLWFNDGKEKRKLDSYSFLGATGQVRATLFSPDSQMIAIAYEGSSDDFFTPPANARIEIINRKGDEKIYKFENLSSVYSIAFNSEGSNLVSGHYDGQIRIWPLQNGRAPTLLTGHTGPVNSIAFDHTGAYIASISNHRELIIWSTRNGKEIYKLKSSPLDFYSNMKTDYVWIGGSLAFHPNSDILAFDGGAFDIALLAVSELKVIHQIESSEKAWINSLCFSNDGSLLASANNDGSIMIWTTNDWHEYRHFKQSNLLGKIVNLDKYYSNPTNSISFNQYGSLLVSGHYDGTIKIWKTK